MNRISVAPAVRVRRRAAWACAALFGAAVSASAQTPAAALPAGQPAHVLNLSATATVEVMQDWLSVTYATTREGADAAAVQGQLKQALDAALAEARKLARPGQVEVRTGAFGLSPRYGQRGSITGWQGSAELVVAGRDVAAISQLASRIQTLAIARVGYSLSREAREKVEAEVAAEAIARFRAQADTVSRQFGYRGYVVREVSVSSDGGLVSPPLAMRAQVMRAGAEDAPLPTEAGRATVTATVAGSVVMQ
jgi:predicted secreted protein